jgi:uncharacterized protein (TIGR02246 family)
MAGSAFGAEEGVNSAQVKAVYDQFNEAFNANDAHAAAALCTADADYIVVTGAMFHGSAQVEQHLGPLFAGRLKGIHRDVSLREIRFIRPDTAVVIADYATSGLTSGAGAAAPPLKGVYDWIVIRRGGQWRISVWDEANLPAPAPAAR